MGRFFRRMKEDFSHYITKNIRSYYKSRLLFPIAFLLFLGLVFVFTPVYSIIFPAHIKEDKGAYMLSLAENDYVTADLHDLYFTGYTKTFLGRTLGYYYYTMFDSDCVIVLLSPDTSEQGLPHIENVTIEARVVKDSVPGRELLTRLADDLSWDALGIAATVSPYILSEPDSKGIFSLLLVYAVEIFSAYAVLSILVYILFIACPILSPPCSKLRAYGSPKKIIEEAEEELRTLPQLATEDMFITEHYFIETSAFGTAVVPIKEILWIYKYSTLHKFLWHHFSISYTLHITANKRQYIHCPKNTKTDIDGIIDYLSEANHDILVGFSEENRLKIEKKQGDFVLLQRFLSFLSKRI